MKNKILTKVACLAMCGTTLFATACRGGGSSGGKATLDFMYTGTQEILELFNGLVAEYNKTQGETDKVKVMAMPVASGGIDGKLTNVLPSSNGPDVVIGTDEYFKKHTKNMMDLTNSFSADFLGNFYKEQESRYHYDAVNITANSDDTLYGLPAVNDPKYIYCKVIYYSDTDESLYRETIFFENTITRNVYSATYNRDNFALEKLPVKVLIEEVDARIDKRPYFIVMAIGFIFGIIGLWKIIFAPLKETWY